MFLSNYYCSSITTPFLFNKEKEKEEQGRTKKKMEEFDFEELQAATESFSHSRLVGKGSHGSVYKGILKNGKLIAIKKSSSGLEILGDNSKIDNEICILSSIPQNNPYVINLLGMSHEYDSITMNKNIIVVEYMPNGSLYDMLHAASTPPIWPKRIEIALQIARAVQFLHELNPLVIHRDIKSANILFDAHWNAKLADFGLAVIGDDGFRVNSLSQPAGTIGYLDPCYTTPCKLSTKIDVFSFGVVLLEIISCRRAIDVLREPASTVDWAMELIEDDRMMEICDTRVSLPVYMEGTIRCILCIATRCVSSEEDQRPSIKEVVMELENCFVQRVRFPIWTGFLRCIILMRRRRKLSRRRRPTAANCATQKGDVHANFPSGKLLLREVLTDITLK